MMSLLRKIPEGFDSVKKGEWDYEPLVGRQVKGLTIGIVGFGRLGKITAELFKGWGVNILVNDPYVGTFDYECQLCLLCIILFISNTFVFTSLFTSQ